LLARLLVLSVLASGLQVAMAAPTSPEDARAALRAELDEGTYTLQRDERARGELLRALVMRLLRSVAPVIQWLGDRVAGGLRALGVRMGVIESVVQVVLVLGALLLTGAIVYWLLRRVRASRHAALAGVVRRTSVAGSGDHELLTLSALRALRAARRADQQGDLRLALRYAFWALLLVLAEQGHYKVELGRTNREYERLLPAGSEGRRVLSGAIGIFERCWYGGQPATADTFQDLVRRAAPLVEAERGRA
jgi:hypothetical protein